MLGYEATQVDLAISGSPPFVAEVPGLAPQAYSFAVTAMLVMVHDPSEVVMNVQSALFGPVQIRECRPRCSAPDVHWMELQLQSAWCFASLKK